MHKIQVQDLSVQFSGSHNSEPVQALRALNLNVADGEFVAVVGPSGCGKTTMLRVMSGQEKPTSGGVTLQESDPKRPNYAMVFQHGDLFPWMTVLENIAYGMRMRGVPGKRRYELALYWTGRVGLLRFADSFPNQLSGGMQQRVGLARAFAHQAEVLLMDEPFAALDAQMRLVLQQTLLELYHDTDATVVFVTHSIEEALTLADRVVVLSARPGQVLAEFDVPFPRPRDPMQLRADPLFGARLSEIWGVLGDQVKLVREEAF
jgi:NitT/TauT family transport system ATP-binding protein